MTASPGELRRRSWRCSFACLSRRASKLQTSLVQKAFHRHKGYKDPYDEIEDKVGLRFVVLLSEDIRVIEEDILACPHWDATKARDFEEEREAKPYEFRLSVIALHRSVAHSL